MNKKGMRKIKGGRGGCQYKQFESTGQPLNARAKDDVVKQLGLLFPGPVWP